MSRIISPYTGKPFSEVEQKRVNFVCALRSGGDYTIQHVIALRRQVRKKLTVPYNFKVITDKLIFGHDLINIRSETDWPGWWVVQEVFRVKGPTIVMGLDSLLYRNIDALASIALNCPERAFYMIHAWKKDEVFADGIMVWNGDYSWLYHTMDPNKDIKKYDWQQRRTKTLLMERGFEIRGLQDYFPGIYSFKHHCRPNHGLPPHDARVILFHGKPRPHKVKLDWVREGYSYYDKV